MTNQNTNVDPLVNNANQVDNANQQQTDQQQANQNVYDPNIDNSRVYANPTMNVGQNPYINTNVNNQNTMPQSQNGFSNSDFLKGALIGAAVTFLLTNKGAQEGIMKAVSKGSELFQAGMEELKERYEDARAQMDANKE